MSNVWERVTSLPPEKRLLLDMLRQQQRSPSSSDIRQRSGAARIDHIPQLAPFSLVSAEDRRKLPHDLEDAYPLGLVQLGMVFHMVLETPGPSTPAYHNVGTMDLHLPAFDLQIFQQAVDHVVARHAILRTAFDLTSYSEPLQLVYRDAQLPVQYEDLRHLSSAEQERHCQDFIVRHNFQIVDLTRAPLVELYVHQLSETTIKLTIIEPHAISDGWSTHLTLVEIFDYNHALLNGQPLPPLDPPAVSYRDFIYLERQALASDEHRQFWRHALENLVATALPRYPAAFLDAEAGWTDHKLYFHLPADLTQQLQRLARAHGVSLKSVLLAAHLKVLGGATGQSDLTVGLTFNGRPEVRGGDDVRGLFLNTLPLRVKIRPCSWLDLIQQAYQGETEILPYRRYPLAQVQHEVGQRTLIDVMFSYHHFHSITASAQSGKVSSLEVVTDLSRTNFPLEVTFHLSAEAAGQLTLLMDYDVTQLSRSQILELQAEYVRVLTALSTNPHASHTSYGAAADERWQRQIAEWNATAADYAEDRPIHMLIAAQAARTPDAIALQFEDTQLTYRELNRRANQVAHHLQALGVTGEVRVGICVERSIDMVIGLLGILKASGAYIPLDPEYPAERLQYMLADAQVAILLTQQRLVAQLPSHTAHVVCLDADWQQIVQADVHDPSGTVSDDQAAYIIYTSGSTGQPKGAINTHAGLRNRLLWMQATFALDASDRVLQKTPFSFDVSVWEFFWPLMFGAQLVVAKPGGHRDSPYLIQTIIEHEITTLHFVPSMLQIFLADHRVTECTSLRRIICSGEALSLDLQQRCLARLSAELHNLYGPTEAAIDVTWWPCLRDRSYPTVPLGHPIANTQMYILDRQGQPVAAGVAGELYIGGVQLARGYHHRPVLTAEKFVPDPFAATPGARLYRTGDLGRFWPDGTIEYLGRMDYQVKLRGFRIELGEIETAIEAHPSVHEAVVVARDDMSLVVGATNKRLVAYIVSAVPTLQCGEVRQFLKQRLPEYMVPTAFVFLESMPLTPNGKLDRGALPVPARARPDVQLGYVAPRTALEQTLVDIWCQLFGLDRIGIHDNFFELGGDSIISLQMITRAQQANINVTLQHILQHQTIAQLAADATTSAAVPVVDAEQGIVTGELLPTPNQALATDTENPDGHIWNITWMMEVKPLLDADLLRQAVKALLVHHDALRIRSVKYVDGGVQFFALPDDEVPLALFDFSNLPPAERTKAIETTAGLLQQSLSLPQGPMLRIALFDLGPETAGRLLFIVHHMVCDHYGADILWQDLLLAYRQLSQGEPIQLPPKTTSLKSYVERMTEYTQAGNLDHELPYWLSEPRQRVQPLPVDYAGGVHTGATAHTIWDSLSREETRILQQLAGGTNENRLLEVLLAALVIACEPWSGSSALLLDIEHHGRQALFDNVDLSRTVAWLNYRAPLLLDIQAASDPWEAVAIVQAQRQQMPNHGIGHGMLRYLRDDEEIISQLRALPQPQLLFNYRGRLASDRMPDGFQLASEAIGIPYGLRFARRHLLLVDGQIVDDELQIEWTYGEQVYRGATVEGLMQRFLAALRSLITSAQPDLEQEVSA